MRVNNVARLRQYNDVVTHYLAFYKMQRNRDAATRKTKATLSLAQ